MADAYTSRSDGHGCRDWRWHKHSNSTAGQESATQEMPNRLRLQPDGLFSPSYSGPTPYARGPSVALGQMSRRAGAPYVNARSASGSYVLGQRIQNSPAAACEFDDVHRFLYELPNACTKRTRASLMRRDQPEQRRLGSADLQHPLATECQESAEVGAKHHPNWKQPSAVGLLSYFSRTSTAVAEDGSILRELTLDPSRDYQRVAQAGGSTMT